MKEFDYEFYGNKFQSPVFVVADALPVELIDEIVKKYPLETFEEGQHIQPKEQDDPDSDTRYGVNKDMRKSKVLFLEDEMLDKFIFVHMQMANWHLGLRYKITGAEQTQLTAYEGKTTGGGHYDWHTDGPSDHYCERVPVFGKPSDLNQINQPHLAGTVRKISCSIILNDDFEGGDFQVRYLKYGDAQNLCIDQTDTFKPVKGHAIFFRSDLFHRVTPVTKGTRYSLVKWFAGPPIV